MNSHMIKLQNSLGSVERTISMFWQMLQVGLLELILLRQFSIKSLIEGENFFVIQTSANNAFISGFCKDAAFKLTMDYNNGALECECDFYGSESFECEEFGGQCPCRRNVIGRKCNRCKTGFFGFPDCKPCDCPSTALCDPVSGWWFIDFCI